MQPPFLVIGAAHWDIVAQAVAPLGPGADVPGRVRRQPGGVGLNLAVGLAAAGQPVELVATLGRDPAGDALAAAIEAAGVGTRGLLRTGATDAYVAIETASGALHAAVADCTVVRLDAVWIEPSGRKQRHRIDGSGPSATGVVANGLDGAFAIYSVSADGAGRLAAQLHISTDRGRTWQQRDVPPTAERDVRAGVLSSQWQRWPVLDG